MAAITEKQRVSLPISLWLSLAGIIVTGAGAWFATQARAENTAQQTAANAEVLVEHSRTLQAHELRLQRGEDAQAWQREMLERIDAKLDRLQRKDER